MNNDIRNLLNKMTLAADKQKADEILTSLGPRKDGKPARLAFVNAHALNLCSSNPGFLHHLLESDYILRDGSGMKILFKMLGINPGLNLNGTDLIPEILHHYAGCNSLLFGTKEPYLGRAANIIRNKGVTPVCTLDGFQEDELYLRAAQRHPAQLIILGMGMPKQERVASLLARNLDYPCLIICGGAILDFISGKVSRAPAIFRRFGMEWLYRLAHEPRRLFRRYIIGNFVFLLRGIGFAFENFLTAKSFSQK